MGTLVWSRWWLPGCFLQCPGAAGVFPPDFTLAGEVEGFAAEGIVVASGCVFSAAGRACALVNALQFGQFRRQRVAFALEGVAFGGQFGFALLGLPGVGRALDIHEPCAVALDVKFLIFNRDFFLCIILKL